MWANKRKGKAMPSGDAAAVENQSEARHIEETEQPLWEDRTDKENEWSAMCTKNVKSIGQGSRLAAWKTVSSPELLFQIDRV